MTSDAWMVVAGIAGVLIVFVLSRFSKRSRSRNDDSFFAADSNRGDGHDWDGDGD